MTLGDDYLRYQHRGYGMDHDRYEWSILARRAPIRWPDGARVALWVVPALEWFPLDMGIEPFAVPGALDRPYPDYWNYTSRDYGNRIGYYRVARVLSQLGVKPSVAVNSALAARYPSLLDDVCRRGWEVIAHGVDMGHLHHGGLDVEIESQQVNQAVTTLRERTGQAVTGWLSPGKSQSPATLDLIAEHQIEYVCDWVNDDLPYAMRSSVATVYSMPHAYETDDRLILSDFHHTEDQYLQQLRDHFDTLYSEAATDDGRIFCLSLHPWVIGQPFRIKTLERALTYVLAHAGVWPASGAEILAAFKASSERQPGL